MKTIEELKKMSVNEFEKYLKSLKYCVYKLNSKYDDHIKEIGIEYRGFEFDAITNAFSINFKRSDDSINDEDRIYIINTIYGYRDVYHGVFENSNELRNAVNQRIKEEKQEKIAELEKQLTELKLQLTEFKS